MADQTKIEWTDATWNPITGCTLVDEGCRNCYAAELAATRLKRHPSRAGLARRNAAGVSKFTGEVRFNKDWLTQPMGWSKPRMVFVCAHGDLFHPAVPDDWIDRVFAVMALCPQHTFQVLTKRPERAARYLSHLQARIYWNDIAVKARAAGIALLGDMALLRQHRLGPLPNVWLGTSISDQASADTRIPQLLEAPAKVRFLSAEPLLGPLILPRVDFHCDLCGGTGILARWPKGKCHHCGGRGEIPAISTYPKFGTPATPMSSIDWIIVGGESGRNARPMHPDWARSLRDQCQATRTAFFFKQWGEWLPASHAAHLGDEVDDCRFGEWHDGGRDWIEACMCSEGDPEMPIFRVGKKAAGRLLDGREWNGVPL